MEEDSKTGACFAFFAGLGPAGAALKIVVVWAHTDRPLCVPKFKDGLRVDVNAQRVFTFLPAEWYGGRASISSVQPCCGDVVAGCCDSGVYSK